MFQFGHVGDRNLHLQVTGKFDQRLLQLIETTLYEYLVQVGGKGVGRLNWMRI